MPERQRQRTPDQLAQLEAMEPTMLLILQVIRDHGQLPMSQLSEIIGSRQEKDGEKPSKLNLGPHNSLEELVGGMSGQKGLLTKKGADGTTIFSVGFQGHRFLATHASSRPRT